MSKPLHCQLSTFNCPLLNIDSYTDHLIRLDEILFILGSGNIPDLSKEEVFDLLNENHLLRADLLNLKE